MESQIKYIDALMKFYSSSNNPIDIPFQYALGKISLPKLEQSDFYHLLNYMKKSPYFKHRPDISFGDDEVFNFTDKGYELIHIYDSYINFIRSEKRKTLLSRAQIISISLATVLSIATLILGLSNKEKSDTIKQQREIIEKNNNTLNDEIKKSSLLKFENDSLRIEIKKLSQVRPTG